MLNPFEDLRYALRGFRKNPMFTAIALASLALGIGANTAVFSLMDQVLLRSLPVKHPEQLVLFQAPGPRRGRIDTSYGDQVTFSYPMYRDFRDRSQVFDGVMARFPVSLSMSWRKETDRIHGDLVSGNYFEVLGVKAALGRTLSPEDDRKPGASPYVVLSYGFWKRRFGGDPGVLNQSILLNAHPMTILGVAQDGFHGVGVGEAPDVFVPIMMRAQMSPDTNDLEERRSYWLNVFGRLKPGVSRAQAEVAMNVLWKPILQDELKNMQAMSEQNKVRFANRHLSLQPGAKGISSPPDGFADAMKALMAMVGLLLLIACANVANLLIARATSRQREIGIRLAMGASRVRLIRQLLLESLLLAIGGGLLGLLVADWTGTGLLRLLPDDPSTHGIAAQTDARIFLFTLGLSVVTGLLFGLVPALQGTRQELATTLKDQASAVLGGFGSLRWRKSLVATQVALSLVLLVGAGLFARSLYNIKNLDAGFRTDHLISFAVQPALNGYSQERMRSLFERLRDDLARIPGVRGVSMAHIALLAGDNEMSSIDVEGYRPKEDEDMTTEVNAVGPGFLATLGIPLLAGRDFSAADGANTPRVVIINETFAKYFFKGDNPVGHHVLWRKQNLEIAGVAKDSKFIALRDKKRRLMYVPYTQSQIGGMTFYARTAQEPDGVIAAIRQEVRRQDPNLPIFNVRTMEQQIDSSLSLERLVAVLSAAFGILATTLAAIGLYGVMAYMVVRRTREIGIRMALGAAGSEVLRMVMGEVVKLAAIGIAVAVAASLALGRLIESLLLGVSGRDPWVLSAAVLVLAIVALLAGFLPAMRASRVDPLAALRYE